MDRREGEGAFSQPTEGRTRDFNYVSIHPTIQERVPNNQ